MVVGHIYIYIYIYIYDYLFIGNAVEYVLKQDSRYEFFSFLDRGLAGETPPPPRDFCTPIFSQR